MLRYLVCLLPFLLPAAENPNSWDKVKELKSGAEIRILRDGIPTPLEGKLDEVRDDDIVLVIKNEQKAIRKDTIIRVDARPKGGSRITTETKHTVEQPDTKPSVGMAHGAPVPGASTSSGISLGSKPAYETVYRRLAHHGPTNAPAAEKK